MREKRTVLSARDRTAALQQLPLWRTISKATKLRATFSQPDYISGLVFVARIAVHAEVQQHYPEVLLKPGTVTVTLTTAEAGGITRQDVILATIISNLATKTYEK